MKKFLFLTLIFGAIISTTTYAQPAGDPATILQQMKEKQKPGLAEKVGLTDAQADKVIEINYEMRMQAARELKDLNEADRTKKLAELKAAKEKKFSEFLTAEQIKAMNTYYEEMRKNMPKKGGN
jgi:Spy/CpxP family protein refolding chaperone